MASEDSPDSVHRRRSGPRGPRTHASAYNASSGNSYDGEMGDSEKNKMRSVVGGAGAASGCKQGIFRCGSFIIIEWAALMAIAGRGSRPLPLATPPNTDKIILRRIVNNALNLINAYLTMRTLYWRQMYLCAGHVRMFFNNFNWGSLTNQSAVFNTPADMCRERHDMTSYF